LFSRLPQKPVGINDAAIINIRKGKIVHKTQNFKIKSVHDLSDALIESNKNKTSTVTVDGDTYKLRKMGNNFFYGAIVNKGGIGAYVKHDYVLVITHDNFITAGDFAYVFGQVIQGLHSKSPDLKSKFLKDDIDQKKDEMKTKLTTDGRKYDDDKNSKIKN
jgi:hypothetical protein